jgi:hypothetical protein
VTDSGARLFLNGEYYYRHVGDLCVSLCVAQTISDVGWREYLEGTLIISKQFGRFPKVGAVAFTGVHPNAGQRGMTTKFLADENVRPLARLALLTNSELLRGAMTAFSWAMPKSRLRAFKASDHSGGFRWLQEAVEFDEKAARAIWSDACTTLNVVVTASGELRKLGS